MSNPYEEFFRDERDNQMRVELELAPPPDQAARTTKIARAAGVPPLYVEDNLDAYERGQQTQAFVAWANRFPAAQRFMADNPRTAMAAQDDHKSLGMLAGAWESWGTGAGSLVRKVGGALESGGNAAAAGLSDLYLSIDETILPFTNPSGGREILNRRAAESEEYRRRADAAMPKGGGFVEQSLLQGIKSVPTSLTALGIGMLTRSPGAAAGAMGTMVAAPSYQEARRAGKAPLDALRYGITQGGIEYVTEKMPASSLLAAITNRSPFGKTLLTQLAQEIPGEQVATYLQDLNEWTTLNPEGTASEFLAARPSAALQTLLATMSGTSVQTGVVVGSDRAARAAGNLATRVTAARRAKAEARIIDQLGKAAQDSKLRARDPVAHSELVGSMAEEAGAGSVFIPGAAIKEFLQSDSYDPYDDPFGDYSEQIEEAAAAGGDVVLPASFALGTLPGTPAWAALKDDMRLTSGGASAREAEGFEAEMADIVAEMEAQQEAAGTEGRDARTKLADSIAAKLGNSYTAPAARTMAEVTATYLERRSGRLGQQIDGTEFDNVNVRQTVPGVDEAEQPDDAVWAKREAVKAALPETVREFVSVDEMPDGSPLLMAYDSKKRVVTFAPASGAMSVGNKISEGKAEEDFSKAVLRGRDPAVVQEAEPEVIEEVEPDEEVADELTEDEIVAALEAVIEDAVEPAETAPTKRIEDAGEKIGGARKDRWAERGMSVADLEGMDQAEAFQFVTKDQVWPKPDYGEMIANGATPEAAAAVKILRDSLAAKPKADSADARLDYVTMMGHARDLLSAVKAIGDIAPLQDQLYELAGYDKSKPYYDRSPETMAASRKLFSIVKGRRASFRIGFEESRKIKKMLDEGFPAQTEPWKRRFTVVEYNRVDPPWHVLTKTRRRAMDTSFATREEAEAAAKELYGQKKDKAAVPERPHLDSIQRSGADVRGGRDVAPEDFIKEFGFRGVEFGNWVASDERQKSVNLAFEAFHDLANVLGIPPRALSLNDQLALAFGARGGGFGVAHYEPGKLVINLTKISGAGSLAHEWGHALDHYFGVLDTDLGTRGAPQGASGWYDKTPSRLKALGNLRPEMAEAFDRLMSSIFEKDKTRGDAVRDQELRIEKLQAGIERQKAEMAKAEERGGAMVKTFLRKSREWLAIQEPVLLAAGRRLADLKDEAKPLTAAKVRTSFYGNAAALSGKSGDSGYWARPTEMFARSFESYVFDKIAAQGNASQYLVQGVEGDRYASDKYAGNPYPAGMERDAINAAYDDLFGEMKVRESGEGALSLYQSKAFNEGAHARIEFDQAKITIELFQSRNLSSFFHEMGHMALENLRVDAMLEEAPDQLREDWQAVQQWFKTQGHDVTDAIPVEAHEMWARGFERYLMEGKAPSTGLKRVFEEIRGWMLAIYKTVAKLNSPITPEIREVFDRLLATEEEIEQAREQQGLQALFKDAAAIGMTGPEWQAYQRQIGDARAEAHTELVDKTMRAVRRRETERYREMREGVRAEIEEAVNARPVFRAIRDMVRSPVNREWIVEEFGAEALDLLPRWNRPLHKPGGVDPSLTAEFTGFATGRDMIEALTAAQDQQRQAKEGGDTRGLRERIIETETDEEMNRRVGDPLNDGSIEREALAAVHNEMQGEVIATELRVLSRKTGQRATPYRLARDWARGRVRSGRYVDEASPQAIQRHARNAARAGREAEKAMAKQDHAETFRLKQQQMLNSALLSEAKAAHDEVEAAVKRLGKVAKARTMKAVDQDYLEQAQALLEAVELKPKSQISIERKAKFEAWAAAVEQETGEEVYVPERFDYEGTHWTRLAPEVIIGMDDAVKSILHLGRRKKELQIGKDKRDWNEARGEWLEQAEGLAERPASEDRNPRRSKVRGLFSNFIRTDKMAKVMDGGDPNGLMTRVLSYGPKNADNTYARIKQEVLQPIVDHYMGMKGNRLTERVSVPEWIDYKTGGPSTFLRSDLLAIALNLGSESNLRKMLAGETLLFKGQEHLAPTLEGVNEMLARELNEAEWQMVALAWERVNSMWPEIAADERERTGVEPERVEPRQVETPIGTLEGGYWPAVYDTDPVRKADAGVNLPEAGDIETALGLTGKGIGTAKGHTISRTDFVAPMFLNLEGVLFGHVDQVAKRIAYQNWGTQALKVIRDPRIKAMWTRKLGKEYHGQLEPWVRDTINQGVLANTGHLADFNGIIKATRMNLTVMGLVGRITTLFAQIGGLTSSVNAIGFSNMMNGIAISAANYGENKRRIYEASPLIRRRIDEFDRDQLAALAELSRPRTSRVGKLLKPAADVRDRWNAFGFHMIGAVQLHLVDIPTWAGAYAQATGASENGGLDMDHDAAVDYADNKVEDAQGAGRAAQLAAIQRSGEMSRIITLFYTFFGTQLNYQWEMTQDVRQGSYRKATKSAFWVMIATPLLGGLLADAIRGDLPDDDNEDTWLAWVCRKVFFGMFNNIPVVRDFSNQAERKMAGKYAPDPATPWQRLGSAIAGGGKDAFAGVSQTDWYRDAEQVVPFLPDPQEVSDKWIKHSLEALGFATGTGLGQIATSAQFVADVNSGAADPETVGDYAQGLTTGKVKAD